MPRMTEQDLAALTTKRQSKIAAPLSGVRRWQALGRLPKGKMNKTEAEFAEYLNARKHDGEVLDWRFHPMRIRLADSTYYEVDFLALGADMVLTMYETKGGYTSEKGQMKIKLVAEVLPFFRMVKATKLPKKDGGGWKLEEFNE